MLDREIFRDILNENDKIFAVVDEESYFYALSSGIKIIFILDASIYNLQIKVNKLLRRDKVVFVHIDMVLGFDSSPAVIDYIAMAFKGKIGIITTRNSLVKKANQRNLRVIYRAFMVDSTSKKSLINNLASNAVPDAVEIMPASSIKAIKEIRNLYPNIPVIAGGLISEKSEAVNALISGANAISTSSVEVFK